MLLQSKEQTLQSVEKVVVKSLLIWCLVSSYSPGLPMSFDAILTALINGDLSDVWAGQPELLIRM